MPNESGTPPLYLRWTWVPLLLAVVSILLPVLGIVFSPLSPYSPDLFDIGFYLYLGVLLYVGVQLLECLFRRQWKRGFFSFLRLLFCSSLLVAWIAIAVFLNFSGPSEDHFSDGLTIPSDASIREPAPFASSARSIRTGKPELNLANDFQGGMYQVEIWANPGEPGTLYLKAYELTKNYRLSASRLAQASNLRIGWSTNPDELFFGNSRITIYEGDWDHYYAARFELWFRPDSGKGERKLLEQNYKIQGWQR